MAVSMVFLAGAVLFTLQAFRDNIVFFYSPSDVISKKPEAGRAMRLGGLVKDGSVDKTGERVRFVVTDGAEDIVVVYTGLLPNLFREGQGVVAQGALSAQGEFVATQILAKHDETYMPREVVESLKKAGRWKGDAAP
ncbi:MAG: cytochrome c maturation protein CcmE [Rickettsiales bacterium]|nr:cytochrome c maturation protein CcmE [Rickettsiales bacterium]